MEDKYQKEIAQLIAKAWTDPAFKEKLMKNPKEAFLECGIPCPEGVDIHVFQNTKSDWNFALPMKPKGELSDEDLSNAAGGAHFLCCKSMAASSGP